MQDVYTRFSHFRLSPYLQWGALSDDSVFIGIQPIESFKNIICGQHACCQ